MFSLRARVRLQLHQLDDTLTLAYSHLNRLICELGARYSATMNVCTALFRYYVAIDVRN